MAIYQKYIEATEQPKVFKLRPEQEEAIMLAKQKFFNYSDTKTKGIVFKEKRSGQQKFLWNAKMRFGKTVCALQLVKDCEFKRTLILTHRPVVDDGWHKDFKNIVFKDCPNYAYVPKDVKLAPYEKDLKTKGISYIYFASMHDLRGSEEVGGKFSKNDDVFSTEWDCIIVDEAHEGTKTELGEAVLKSLLKADTKLLQLSGTPFNLYEEFGPDEIFTWDYIREQKAKAEWKEEDGPNPYATLPKLKIFTYKMMHLVDENNDGNGEFRFKDFFRVVTKKDDPRRGRFVNEDNVIKFLNKMCTPGDSNYPFTTAAYQTYFKHTLWIVPGVKEAKALEHLLNKHEVFKNFRVVNVAGTNDDDELKDSALENVKTAIKDTSRPYTITLSCGRLTTGVTVPEWTAVFYLKGSENTKASTYLQTIFRVQSPHVVGDMMKSECYVFDFAPERTLQMMAETASFSRKIEKKGKRQISDQEDIEKMEELLEYMPVTSLKDGKMKEFDYEASNLFGKLENVYADRVARHGFADPNLYNVGILDNLTQEQKDTLIETLKILGGPTKVDGAPKNPQNDIVVNSQDENDLTPEEKAALEAKRAKEAEEARLLKEAKAKARKEAWENLTPEEQERIERDRAEKAEKRKQRKQNEAILTGISIRVPLMMYGADVTNENDDITVDNFTAKIDDDSWNEFMPKDVTKDLFNKLKIFYNPTIFREAGKKYRVLAREADFMTVEERIQRITEIFSWFHNPDKETVLTPWRVVNMHMSDCLGGYCFYNEDYSEPLVIEKKESTDEKGNVTVTKPIVEPRRVDVEGVTDYVFGDPDTAKILEINSKSGLYPLYIAYSLYRKRFEQYTMHELWDKMSVEETQLAWDDVIKDNLYVICNTDMAARITRRTLLGYRDRAGVEGYHKVSFIPNIKNIQLVKEATENRDNLIKELKCEGFWTGDDNNTNEMKFNAIVGNPPYDVNDGGGRNGAASTSVYDKFVRTAKELDPKHISMIIPAKWYSGGRGLSTFRREMLSDTHIVSLFDFPDSKECFTTVDIPGGVCYFHRDKEYSGLCSYVSINKGVRSTPVLRDLNEKEILVRNIQDNVIVDTVKAKTTGFMNEEVYESNPFGFRRLPDNHDIPFDGCITLYGANLEKKYLNINEITEHTDLIGKWKVIISKASAEHAGMADANGRKRILSHIKAIPPQSICTETFLLVGAYDTEEIANNVVEYFRTSFARYMLSTVLMGQNISRNTFANVPVMDFSKKWTDASILSYFGLMDEQNYIESIIKPIPKN